MTEETRAAICMVTAVYTFFGFATSAVMKEIGVSRPAYLIAGWLWPFVWFLWLARNSGVIVTWTVRTVYHTIKQLLVLSFQMLARGLPEVTLHVLFPKHREAKQAAEQPYTLVQVGESHYKLEANNGAHHEAGC